MATRINVRRDTLANWQSSDPILSDGEPAWVSDTKDLIAGDGASHFSTIWANAQSIPNRATAAANAAAASAADAAVNGSRNENVRITAVNLPTWSRKKQLASLGQAPARILCVGDSTTAGVYSDSYTTATGSTNQGGPNAYPARLAAYLTARGVPAMVGMAIPGHAGNADSRWGGTAGQNYAGGNLGAGANSALTMTQSGQTIILTPGVKADSFIVYYYGDAGTGTFTAQATGGSATTVTTSAGGNAVKKSAVITATASTTTNTVTLTWASGTSFIEAIEFYDSTNPNVVRVLPAGVGGSQAAQWAANASSDLFGGQAFIAAVAPDLTIMSLGINDDSAGRSASEVMGYIDTLAAKARLSGDVLLMSAFPHPSATSLDAINAAYYASSYPYVDLAWRYGRNIFTMGFMTVDQTHPNALGYGDAASVVARALA